MKKGEIYEGIIEKVDFPNKGRVQIGDRTVIVKNGMPGQKIRFQINKKKGTRLEGRLLEVLEKSPLETREPVCSIFPACGGCMYQTMSYEHQLQMKAEQIKKLIDTAVIQSGQVDEHGNADYTFEGIKGSPQEFAYRNKMEFSFGDEYKDGPLSLGLHKKGSTYDVLNACDCKLVHEDMTKILTCVLEYCREQGYAYYHKMQHTGFLRHLLLRRGNTTGEILVNLVTTSQEQTDFGELKERLLREYIGNTKDMTVFDLYSGTGTISQILASVAKEVIGVEIVEEAVVAAKENAKRNGIENCRFLAGDVLKVLDEIEERPDFIVLDPPRDGIHPKALPKIIDYGVDKLVYISCKPTSLARDLEMFLGRGYRVEKVCCVDQFCQTVHCETICKLVRK